MVKISNLSLSRLIGEIYDCSFDPGNWSQALTAVSQAFDAAYTVISMGDPRDQISEGRMAAFSPWDPLRLRELNEVYGVEGVPGLKEVATGQIDEPRSTFSQMSEDVFQQSDFYKHWAKPQGLREACVTKFVQTHDRVGIMAQITRTNRAPISADDRNFIALLAPHIRRACMIGDLLNYQRIAVATYQSALSSLATPVILTDSLGKIVHANEAAETLLRAENLVSMRFGKLKVLMPQADHALSDAIARTAEAGKALGQRGIGIPLSTRGATPAIAYVLPLAGERERSVFGAATAAIFISQSISASPPPETALVALFNLTPAEARVMCRLGEGIDNAEIARQMDVSINTLKTHIQRIHQKTNTSKQAEICKLIGELGSPEQPRK